MSDQAAACYSKTSSHYTDIFDRRSEEISKIAVRALENERPGVVLFFAARLRDDKTVQKLYDRLQPQTGDDECIRSIYTPHTVPVKSLRVNSQRM